MKHKITSKSLLDLKIPGAPSVSPDGRHVVFSLRESNYEESRNVSRLWLADVEEGKCRQLTFSYEGEHAPQWSPDGKWIGFVSSRPNFLVLPDHDDDDEETDKDQVWVMPVGMGEAVRLTNANQGVREFRWTPDSKSIIYLVDEARPSSLEFANREDRHKKIDPVVEHFDKRRKQFWEISVEEKKPELIYTGDYGIEELEISPDGKHIVFTSNGTGEPNDYHLYELYVMELEGESDPNKLVDAPGGKSMPRWSPDGTKIAYVAGLDPKLSYSQECVFLVGASGGVPTNLSEGIDWDVELIHWDPGSQELLALAAEKTFAPLFAYRENKWVKLDGPVIGAVCLDFDSGRDGTIAAVAENRMTVPELFVKAKDADWKQVSNFGEAFLKNHELPEIEVINWTSDIGEIEGVVVSPSGKADAQLPLVIQVHGGPKGNSLASLRSYCHHAVFAAEGYRVLMPNYRGSAGYGNTFAVANRRDLGGGDFRDIMAGIDHLEARGLATPGKIGIMGGSYGGYMTNWAIGQTNRFTAAISMFGIFNLV
ncbi:MAG: prolyl oligopeptidase family serine peptidase, partial [Chthonomonadales bacterium]